LHLGGFVFTEQAGVDEDVPRIDTRLMDERGEHGGIDATGDAADDLASRHLGLDARDQFILEGGDLEFGQVLGEGEEVLEDIDAFLGVRDLGVELDALEKGVPFQGDGDAIEIPPRHLAALGEDADGVGMAHPDLGMAFQTIENAVDPGFDHQGGGTVFARVPGGDFATELAVEQLHPVTDSENGDAQGDEVIEIDVRRTGFAGGARAARKDHGRGRSGLAQFLRLIKFGEITELTDPAHDELGVLRAEIDDGDGMVHERGRPKATVKSKK